MAAFGLRLLVAFSYDLVAAIVDSLTAACSTGWAFLECWGAVMQEGCYYEGVWVEMQAAACSEDSIVRTGPRQVSEFVLDQGGDPVGA